MSDRSVRAITPALRIAFRIEAKSERVDRFRSLRSREDIVAVVADPIRSGQTAGCKLVCNSLKSGGRSNRDCKVFSG